MQRETSGLGDENGVGRGQIKRLQMAIELVCSALDFISSFPCTICRYIMLSYFKDSKNDSEISSSLGVPKKVDTNTKDVTDHEAEESDASLPLSLLDEYTDVKLPPFSFIEAGLSCQNKSASATFEDKVDPFPIQRPTASTVGKRDAPELVYLTNARKGSDDDRDPWSGNCVTKKPLLESNLTYFR